MNEQEVHELLEANDAIRSGHFLLSSGKHSDVFVQLEDGIAYVAEAGSACNDPGGSGSLALVPVRLEGDVRAFHELYEAYSKAMYNICLRMTGHSSDAEDVLQEAFVQVFKNLQKLESDSSLTAWIKRIVVNHCLSYLRKKKVYWEEVGDTEAAVETDVDEDVQPRAGSRPRG